jgi:SAM-dependent methyltransferase
VTEEQPDFGKYHHSTLAESAEIRKEARALFTKVFDQLPFSRDEKLKILDVGCGLGFLSCVCAEFYPNATVTGFDTFEHASLKGSSLERARNNAKVLGYSNRIKFRRGDIFRSDYSKEEFSLIVSNLVFHNLGRKRFEAYERLARWTKPKSYSVLGDFFFDYKADLGRFSNLFASVEEKPTPYVDLGYRMLVLSLPVRKTGRTPRK